MTTRMYVTCPSIAIQNPAERAALLRRGRAWCELLGWELVPSPLLGRYLQPGCWLPAAERAEDMLRALEHEVVWACKGGYAAVHLAPALLEAPAPAGRPLLIGYSDTTVLHACWQVRGFGQAVYGTLSQGMDESRQAAALDELLRGRPLAVTQGQEPAGRVLRPGSARGPLFAACLVVLASLTGTPAMPDLRGRILAVEDTNEWPYAVDFALQQLWMAGALDGVAGLLGGSFPHTTDAAYGGPTVDEILAGWAERLGVPAVSRLPYGHLDDHLPIPSGVPCALDAAPDGSWSLRCEALAAPASGS